MGMFSSMELRLLYSDSEEDNSSFFVTFMERLVLFDVLVVPDSDKLMVAEVNVILFF